MDPNEIEQRILAIMESQALSNEYSEPSIDNNNNQTWNIAQTENGAKVEDADTSFETAAEEPHDDQPTNIDGEKNPFEALSINTKILEEGDWKHLLEDFSTIPDYTSGLITQIPQVHALYQAYCDSYSDPAATNTVRMNRGKALVYVLLSHYYPASQGFHVEPASLGPVAKHGLNFILGPDKAAEEAKRIAAKKGKKKGNSAAKKPAKFDEAAYITKNMFILDWDWVRPEDIAGFVVTRTLSDKEQSNGNGGKETTSDETKPKDKRIYTYLALIIDDMELLPRHLPSNVIHRSDVLADALCRTAGIDQGYGILIYGPRLEIYKYDADVEWVHHEDGEHEPQDVDPKLTLMTSLGGKELVVDMRSADLQAMDHTMKHLCGRVVLWMNDADGEGQAEENGGSADEMDEN